jgi:hypothetical protein
MNDVTPDEMPWWPEPGCDLIEAPLADCCGVLAQLDRDGVVGSAALQIGDRLLLLVAAGSTASHRADIDGLPPDLVLHGTVHAVPAVHGVTDSCWLLPPPKRPVQLPSAAAVLAALASAPKEQTGRSLQSTTLATAAGEPATSGHSGQ